MKIYDSNDPWQNPQSYIKSEYDQSGKLIVFGQLIYHGTEFRFRLTQQHTGGAVMRGSVSVLDPDGYHIMQVSGSKKAEVIEHIEQTRPEYFKQMIGKRMPELNMSTNVYCNSLEIAVVKERVSKAVLRLYTKHAVQIHRAYGEIARPETITPCLAAHKYVDKYMEKTHAKLTEKSYNAYRQAILLMCMELPYVPMSTFKVSMVQSYFETKAVSQHKRDLLRRFWEYCQQSKIYIGPFPFQTKQKKKLSPSKAIRNAIRPDDLSIAEQDRLFDLINSSPTGGDTGLALQLWGGYSAKQACTIMWGDIIWTEGHSDYVRVRYFIHDLVGATHNFTSPLFPAGALILRNRFIKLSEKYTNQQLSRMPIVSQEKDPTKAMSAAALVQYTTMRLHSIGLSYEAMKALHNINPDIAVSRLLLTNTYAKNVNLRCSLLEEVGTAKFLLHESLSSSVSDDHYTCFTDEEAGERLHTIMSCVIPEEAIGIDQEPIVLLPDGQVQYTFTPETTRQRVGHVGQYTLKPQEEIIIKVPHGATGSAIVRGFNDDGTLRRKTKSKKPNKLN